MKKKNRISSSILVWVYLAVSVIGIILVSHQFNLMITSHDNELTTDVDQLIAEKMNRSVDYMQQSVEEMANVLSYQDLLEFDQLYEQLTDSIPESDYISIGIVAKNGMVYGQKSEQEEMKKWNLIDMAAKTDVISISEPYRSTLTGKLVFTMFSPIYQQGERLGCIFVTYPLSEIQAIANSSVLKDEVEIYLMNAKSDNIILCSGKEAYLIGNWNSAKLMKHDISADTIKAYRKWENKMKSGEATGTVKFTLNDVSYIQVYEKIDSMDGWYVVVRIPDDTLSDTLQEFRQVVIVFVVILLLLSLGLLTVLRKRDLEEKERFEYLSTHDVLTGVYNRGAFEHLAKNYIKANAEKQSGALVFIDVDLFKQINDQFGHDCGDQALITFAKCLQEVFDEQTEIARFGGDEFILLIKDMASKKKLDAKMEALKELLQDTAVRMIPDEEFRMHYSAGIAPFPKLDKEYSQLVKYADLALYEVKKNGRNGYCWYEKQK